MMVLDYIAIDLRHDFVNVLILVLLDDGLGLNKLFMIAAMRTRS